MKKWYFYVITRDCNLFHSGYCSDIIKTVENYKQLLSLHYPPRKNRLIYLMACPNKEDALLELNSFTMLTNDEKLAFIEESNPDHYELIPGQNIQL